MPPMCADAPPASKSYQNRPVGRKEEGVERCFAGRRRCDDSGLQGVSFPGTFPCSGRPTLPLKVNGSLHVTSNLLQKAGSSRSFQNIDRGWGCSGEKVCWCWEVSTESTVEINAGQVNFPKLPSLAVINYVEIAHLPGRESLKEVSVSSSNGHHWRKVISWYLRRVCSVNTLKAIFRTF